MQRIKVDSVEEAVRAAKQLKSPGSSFWFRGQAKGWRIRSSLSRIKPEDRELALEKIARYEAWLKHTPGLENLAANEDDAIAVAQHYGLPTNFIDFTTKPEIAGFFASEKAGSDTAADLACIICLDAKDFNEFWKMLAFPESPEFLEIQVPDLWRLEAQHGCFLYCPYDDVEKMYNFDRIFFPNTHLIRSIRRGDVYPERKSHLEVLLDQYFMNELILEHQRAIKKARVWDIYSEMHLSASGCNPNVFPNGLPQHSSWCDSALRPWLELPAEQLNTVRTALDFRLRVTDPRNTTQLVRDVSEQLLRDLFGFPNIRSKIVDFDVKLTEDCDLPEDFSLRLSPRLARLWDGLRGLPYDDEDVCTGIGLCVAFGVALGGDFSMPERRHWERAAQQCLAEPLYLAFGAEDGSYSQGYASSAGLAAAIRPDILSYVSDRHKDHLAQSVEGILQTAWNPKKTFDFRLLARLFAREIAPYQVLERSTTAVFYSPARLASLGLP